MVNTVSDQQLATLIEGACNLLSKLPSHAHIVGIGNSPSWLLYAAQLIAKERDLRGLSFSNLPFSGKALFELHGCWHSEKDFSDVPEIQEHFKKHNHTPEELLALNKPLVYVDYLESGNGGMTPIVALMHMAAKDGDLHVLKNLISVVNIGPNIDGKRETDAVTRVISKPFADPYDPVAEQPIKDGSHPDIVNIPCIELDRDYYTAIGIDCSTTCPGSRLVPSFHPPGTTGAVPFQPPDMDFIRETQRRIQQAVRTPLHTPATPNSPVQDYEVSI